MARNKKTKTLSSLAKLNVLGGPKDLSKNMDKYIYQGKQDKVNKKNGFALAEDLVTN